MAPSKGRKVEKKAMRKQEYVDYGPDYDLGNDFEIIVDWEDRIASYSE